MATVTSSGPLQGARAGRFLLGLFIVVQLLFLFVGNAVPFILDGLSEEQQHGLLARPLVEAKTLSDDWVKMTGQGQGWRLFAPQVQMRAMFLRVEIETDLAAPPYPLPSLFEPDSSGRYLHLPGSDDRLFHVEKELYWVAAHPWVPDKIDTTPHEWQNYLLDRIRERWRTYPAYLAWRAGAGERPLPQSLLLSVRIYPLSVAGRQPNQDEIVTLPLVRWRPHRKPPVGCLPLEVYNKHTGEFQWLPIVNPALPLRSGQEKR